jgi:hypothetical protein
MADVHRLVSYANVMILHSLPYSYSATLCYSHASPSTLLLLFLIYANMMVQVSLGKNGPDRTDMEEDNRAHYHFPTTSGFGIGRIHELQIS